MAILFSQTSSGCPPGETKCQPCEDECSTADANYIAVTEACSAQEGAAEGTSNTTAPVPGTCIDGDEHCPEPTDSPYYGS